MNACDHDGEAACEDDDVDDVPSFVKHGTFAARYLERLLASDRAGAALVIEDALAAGVSVRDIYLTILQPTQYEIGRLWELDRVSIADEHFCTGVSQLVIARLYPIWIKPPLPNAPRALVACVDSELHELGARMVADFLEMEGWDTMYLGASSPSRTVAALANRRYDLLALSTTMTSHLDATQRIIESVRALPSSKQPRILVGGYAFRFDESAWRRLGADGYARDADESARIARALTVSHDHRLA